MPGLKMNIQIPVIGFIHLLKNFKNQTNNFPAGLSKKNSIPQKPPLRNPKRHHLFVEL
jgi:hypothetical protein